MKDSNPIPSPHTLKSFEYGTAMFMAGTIPSNVNLSEREIKSLEHILTSIPLPAVITQDSKIELASESNNLIFELSMLQAAFGTKLALLEDTFTKRWHEVHYKSYTELPIKGLKVTESLCNDYTHSDPEFQKAETEVAVYREFSKFLSRLEQLLIRRQSIVHN